MNKLRAAGLLGGLALAAVTLLTSMPAKGDEGLLISSMVSRLKRFCAAGEYRDVCRYMANIIVPATPLLPYIAPAPGEPDPGPIPADKLAKFVQVASTRLAPYVRPERTCEGCIEKVSDFEALLATNNTSQSIANMMDDACAARFKNDAASAARCTGEVQTLMPYLIDFLLANVPPQTACSSGKGGPMSHCEQE